MFTLKTKPNKAKKVFLIYDWKILQQTFWKNSVVIGRVTMMSRLQATSSLSHAKWAEHPFSSIST